MECKSWLLNAFVLFSLALLIDESSCQYLPCPPNIKKDSVLYRLKQKIFCKYQSDVRPVKNNNDAINVSVHYLLQKLDFDEKTDSLIAYSYFFMTWIDYRLLWNKTDFEGADKISVPSYTVWTPDFDVYNSNQNRQQRRNMFFYTLCILNSDGKVVCVPFTKHVAYCSANLRNWPYDSHTCRLEIGSWAHTGEEINLIVTSGKAVTSDVQMNREWDLVSMTQSREVESYPNETYPYAVYEFVIRRHSGVYSATVVVPAVVLMLMTLVIFRLEHGRSERLYIAAIDMVCHYLFLQYLGNMLPSNGDLTPLLVTFFRDSLILTIMALLTSVLGGALNSSTQPVPMWASGLSSMVLQNRFGQMIVSTNLDTKMNSEVSEGAVNPVKSGWNTFTTVIDLFFFIVAFLVYVILSLGFIP